MKYEIPPDRLKAMNDYLKEEAPKMLNRYLSYLDKVNSHGSFDNSSYKKDYKIFNPDNCCEDYPISPIPTKEWIERNPGRYKKEFIERNKEEIHKEWLERKQKEKKLKIAIKKTYSNSRFWEVLIESSKANPNLFDIRCLICAKALILAAEEGLLVHLTYYHTSRDTIEHYGADIGGRTYDFYGPSKNPKKWMNRNQNYQSIHGRKKTCSVIYAKDWKTLDDHEAVQEISSILKKYM